MSPNLQLPAAKWSHGRRLFFDDCAIVADPMIAAAAAVVAGLTTIVVVVLPVGKTVGGANGDVVVVFAASVRANEGEGKGGGGRGEGGVGVRTPLVVASCVARRRGSRARRAALSVASRS